ncbi:uncharacterized protein CELE_C07G1.15 [Caenorhabditis elegans]|uniref:Uncharacterized protein n=1 Tax=Caenorhabditis elegans TaxID=6239 RepID=U4PMJ4_CAEEL|nr:Uncharacterized protein CELE_C07G1.15 [Caenorhabditis elegans]CDH93317.1 Uncharacterized protein CELE_C07G1.15 [Caenorhabditis elegans]|eukprot:NP_001294523.1 Uncharacterized protein CELE_C07G1.15 [Caenorhabditis elegans]
MRVSIIRSVNEWTPTSKLLIVVAVLICALWLQRSSKFTRKSKWTDQIF